MTGLPAHTASTWRPIAQALAIAALAAAAGLPALATGVHSLSVGAVVLSNNKCQFTNAGPTALAFGSIDPSSTANQVATSSIGFRCTGAVGTAVYNVSSDDGLHESGAGAPRMRHATNAAQYLNYTIDLPRSGSVAKNTNQVLTITGTVLPADFQGAIAGSYADTVVLSIAP